MTGGDYDGVKEMGKTFLKNRRERERMKEREGERERERERCDS